MHKALGGVMYEERVAMPGWALAIGWGVIVVLGAVMLVVLMNVGGRMASMVPLAGVLALVMVCVMNLLLSPLRIRVMGDRMSCGWPPVFVRRVRLEEISSAEVVHINPMKDFGGYGWKWSLDMKRWGFIAGAKRGVELTISGKRRALVVSTNRAEELVRALGFVEGASDSVAV